MYGRSSRSIGRKQMVVIVAALLIFAGFAMARSQKGAEAHEVVTPYPLTCGMVGLNPTFTTNHMPEAGTTPGGNLALTVDLATPATGMAMPTKLVQFSLPKPALIERITGVTFAPGGNFYGGASIGADGTVALTFMGDTQSNAIDLPVFTIAAVTKTSAMVGEKVSWIGPSSIKLDNGTTDTCTPASGAAIQYAPTVVISPDAGCGPTTTEEPGHGEHDHGAPVTTMPDEHGDHGDHGTPTTCPPTTAPPTTSTPTTAPTTRPPITTPTTAPTTRPPTTTPTTAPTTRPPSTIPSTRPPTTRPPVTVPPTTAPPAGGGLLELLKRLICLLFHIGC
jgi:hypothetical protein